MADRSTAVGRCGCCLPAAPATPLPVRNRPALDAVVYRVGTYAPFRRAMIDLTGPMAAELSGQFGLSEAPLVDWTSRQSDDYGIALVEMWATVADILTFYAERYANEAWLRTSVQPDSIRRLAQLLGYRPNPGQAAGTYLSYRLEDDKAVRLQAGLRVQSVPAEGEQPQKFETAESVEADSRLNRVPVYATPVAVDPLAADTESTTLSPGSVVPMAGDPVLLFSRGEPPLEERLVDRVDTIDGRPVVRWSRPLQQGHQEANLRGRSFNLFGHGAPTRQVVSTPQGDSAQSVSWDTAETVFAVTGNQLDLEGTIDGIEVGSQVLVVADETTDGPVVRRRTVEAVEHRAGLVEALKISDQSPVEIMAGSVTRLTVSGKSLDLDARTCRIHELTAQLEPLDWEIPEAPIPAGISTIYVAYPAVDAVGGGRRLILDDHSGQPIATETDGEATPYAVGDGQPEFLAIPLAEPTSRELDAATAHLLGNVVAASHGETVNNEVVGDGDASLTLQEFELAKSPVTHTIDPTAPGGARNSLEILVDGVRWTGRSGLFGSGPTDRVYSTRIDDEQTMSLRFGDGHHGARLPSGRANVTATYRQGLGGAGNLMVGQLTTALDKPVGVFEVANPLPAAGGVEPETSDGARSNAPNTVRTFDRAVSLRDFADLAREFVGVEKALAMWAWQAEERVVHLTVGGDGGVALSGDQLAAIRAYLDQRRDLNRGLRIDEYRPVPFEVDLTVEVEADRLDAEVGSAVVDAIVTYFDYGNRQFGQAVHLSDLYGVVHQAEGVVAANVRRLTYANPFDRVSHGAARQGDVLVHAPIRGARTGRSGAIEPAELATLDPTTDLVVAASGGLVS